MELQDAKDRFVQQWGSLGSNWGINRTMAQIHALFLVSDELLSAEDVMNELKISRGNANINIRTLIDWGLVYKEYKTGERKEFFRGEKNIWLVTQRVTRVRQRQELEPVLQVLNQIQDIESTKENEKEVLSFTKQIKDIKSFAELIDRSLTKISESKESWFMKVFLKMFK